MKQGTGNGRQRGLSQLRWLLVLVCIGCCSCRTVTQPPGPPHAASPATLPAMPAQGGMASAAGMHTAPHVAPASYSRATIPPGVCTGAPQMPLVDGCASCPPEIVQMPCGPDTTQCRPPGITGIRQRDEYLCDGGDRNVPVDVLQDWTVYGLDSEDTVASFDTLDGRTEVEPSTRVCIYAPRFASVRQVSGLRINRQRTGVAKMGRLQRLNSQDSLGMPTMMNQPLQPGRYVTADGIQQFRDQLRGSDVAVAQAAAGMANRFKAYEDLQLIRNGLFDNSEKARLSESLTAALAWTSDQGVQVIIDDITLVETTGDSGPQSVLRYDMPPGKPRLRVVKVASTSSAQPGDEVEFTIRFDNIGDQVVGNVTIVDNLTTRLVYVPDSAECSLEANFMNQRNDGDSLVLRWEILDPLEVGEGGIIRFKCRVR